MDEPGLDDRHRDKNGQISRKHGNTLVETLRVIYGKSFAPGFRDTDKLSDVLQTLDAPSLSQLVHHHEKGTLDEHIDRVHTSRPHLKPRA